MLKYLRNERNFDERIFVVFYKPRAGPEKRVVFGPRCPNAGRWVAFGPRFEIYAKFGVRWWSPSARKNF